MSLIGSVGPFDDSQEDFPTYESRVDLFFTANDIVEKKKVPAFLSIIGAPTFKLVQDLLSPRKPADCAYKDIIDALKAHYKPQTIVIYERFKFYSRNQKSGESINDYVASIKSLARTCEFKDNLEEALRDRFVMGLNSESIQQHLLVVKDLTLYQAVSIASARQTACDDAKALNSSDSRVHAIKQSNLKPKDKFPNSHKLSKMSNISKPKNPCSECGGLHWRRFCKFKDS